jgi:hypothetical protein
VGDANHDRPEKLDEQAQRIAGVLNPEIPQNQSADDEQVIHCAANQAVCPHPHSPAIHPVQSPVHLYQAYW